MSICVALRRLKVCLIAGCATGVFLVSAPAPAQISDTPVAFSIPPQDLNRATLAFAQRAGVRVLYDTGRLSGIRSPGVTGTMGMSQALTALLVSTGLSWQQSGPGAITIFDPNAGTAAGTGTPEGAIELAPIDVSGGGGASGFQGTPDSVYQTPDSVSVVSREAMKNTGARNTRDMLATAPGVYAGEGNGSFPTVSPNIRGLQDSGRVVVSIDGARQNAQRGFGVGASGYQSNSGQAFVDSAFIRQVDISKNPRAAAGSAGSLGGSVVFRTVIAEDFMTSDETWGMETDITGGTNEFNFQGSTIAAVRLSEYLALTGGVSTTDVGEYMPGQNIGGESASSGTFKGREQWSSFLKAEFDNHNDITASLSWMHQDIDFRYNTANYVNDEDVRNDSVVAKMNWDPASELVNLDVNLWYNGQQQDEARAARPNAPAVDIESDFVSFGGVLQNTSDLDTKVGALSLNYGVEAFRDDGTSSATSSMFAQNPTWASSYTAFSPVGQRDVASTFFNGTLEPTDWVTISAGVRYDWYRVKGSPTYYDYESTVINTTRRALGVISYGAWAQINDPSRYTFWLDRCNNMQLSPAARDAACNRLTAMGENIPGSGWVNEGAWVGVLEQIEDWPAYKLDIERDDGEWLPAINIEFKSVDWFRPYVSYAHSFRPPTVLESFFAGGPPSPATGTMYAPNPNLRPETARTFEVGANVLFDGLIREDDSLRFKAAAFYREVDGYIVLGDIITDEVPSREYSSFVNLDGVSTFQGIELEGNYDARRFWIGGALTLLDVDWADKTEIFSNGTLTTDGAVRAYSGDVPPKLKLTIDAGVRLIDEHLQIGVRYNYVEQTMTRRLDENLNEFVASAEYQTIDIYGSLRFDEYVTMRFAVNNVTDLNYVPATSGFTAPGRTGLVSLNVKF